MEDSTGGTEATDCLSRQLSLLIESRFATFHTRSWRQPSHSPAQTQLQGLLFNLSVVLINSLRFGDFFQMKLSNCLTSRV